MSQNHEGRAILPRRILYTAAALVTITLTVGIILLCLRDPPPTCMGVTILTEEEYANYTNYIYADLSGSITHNGEPAAIDIEDSVIYISQAISSATAFSDLEGMLEIDRSVELYFAPDDAFDDLKSAVSKGHAFKLLAATDENYMQYDVIFTTLPILKMEGSVTSVNEEDEAIYSGTLCMWTADDPTASGYSVKTSCSEWHVRGDSSLRRAKKSWKLSLKNENGENNDLSFLGMGSDDDWILNPMVFDDLKIREKFTMDIWEALQSDNNYSTPMTTGEYVEVLLNGQYHGLYLLERRIDRKYLSLNDQDILMKSTSATTPQFLKDTFEVVHSALGEDAAFDEARPYYRNFDPQSINIDNWIDLELLIQLGYMVDNIKYKNTFYLWHGETDSRELYFIPWDTDMSFGIGYEKKIIYIPDLADTAEVRHRQEYGAIKNIDPDLDRKIAERWQTLRQSWLQYERLEASVLSYRDSLTSCAATERDRAQWGEFSQGLDTIDEFFEFVEKRLNWLDAYYADILNK